MSSERERIKELRGVAVEYGQLGRAAAIEALDGWERALDDADFQCGALLAARERAERDEQEKMTALTELAVEKGRVLVLRASYRIPHGERGAGLAERRDDVSDGLIQHDARVLLVMRERDRAVAEAAVLRLESQLCACDAAHHMARVNAPLAAAAARVIECAKAWKDAPPAHAEGCPVGCTMCTLDGNLALAVDALRALEQP